MVSLLAVPFFIALAAAPQSASPVIVVPPAGETQEMVLQDGTRATGRVERVTEDVVAFRTTSGEVLEVAASQVAVITPIAGRVVKGEFWPVDPSPTRLLFAPTGRSLKRGESYLGVYEVSMPFVQIGLTDRISIGGGTPPFFGGGSEHPFWITPKVQVFSGQKTEAAVGVLHVSNIVRRSVGIAYGVVTRGTADAALTVGLGYAYGRGEDLDGGAPVVMVGGEKRLTRTVKLITESYVARGGGLLSGGVRFLGERLSVDFGLAAPLEAESFFTFPIVNFVWTF